jgi:crotonobetainyl-CoA:carnitine CoA-transferase CaiB-like acyl-CoA transferase
VGPLHGTRIIDLSSVLMGPYATRILGDMGADIVKVEGPGGDTLRAIGPMHGHGMGPMFLNSNRNKRSVVLDLKTQAGRQALLRLLDGADALIHNVRPLAMARLGLGYEACRAVNPSIVYVGAVGFDQGGPYAARPAYDDLIQGLSALPSLFARATEREPRYVPMAIVDRFVGVHVANAVLAALLHRQRTGEGQSVEVPMFETMVDAVLSDHAGGAMFDPPLGPAGYPRSLAPERHPYRTRDGHLCVMIYNDGQWRRFFELVGSDAMHTDPRFASITTRTVHAREIHAMLATLLLERSTAEWLEALERADVPAAPLHTLEDLADDPQLEAVGFFEWEDHPTEGRIRRMRPAARWSATPLSVRRHAPRAGEHTREVLAQAGYSSDEIEAMIRSGAAACAGGDR